MFNPFDVPINKAYGPYVVSAKTPRRSMMFVLADGRRTSMSYARWLMTQHLQRQLMPTEHVDHRNDDAMDDRLENYQLLTPAENARKSLVGKPSPQKGIEKGYRHGTMYGWMKKHCSCSPCEAKKQEWHKRRNSERRVGGTQRGPYRKRGDYVHGTRTMYRMGCRCTECRAANTAAARRLRDSKQR